MNRSQTHRWTASPRSFGRLVAGAALVSLAVAGCSFEADPVKPVASAPQSAQTKKTSLAKNIVLEIDPQSGQRRVIVNAVVTLREGQLEGFLTRARTKTYEYIVAADCDAREIHKALLATGAEPGSPVVYGQDAKYEAAHGTKIRVLVRYKKDGKLILVPAQQWIRNAVTQKPLEFDWVFGGSRLIPDPDDATKQPFYEANIGDIICVYNMTSAMLDLPVKNPNTDPELRQYHAYTERIPPLGTRVEVILEPVTEKAESSKEEPKAPDAKE